MELNEKPKREKYKVFEGVITEQMPKLIADKRIPMTFEEIADRIINSKQDNWRNNWFDTCDAIVCSGNKIKIIKRCPALLKLNEKTKLIDGGIRLQLKAYNNFKDKEFDKNKVKLNEELTKKEALKHPIWKYLLGKYHKKYVELVFKENETAMGMWVLSENLILCSWFAYGFCLGAWAFGYCRLGYARGRLVGVAKEKKRR